MTFYTSKGDDGTTNILGEGRVMKYHARIEAVGTLDESSAALGLARAQCLDPRSGGELSGGQQQRMSIARALAQEAELMLMDEPFTGLDAPSQEAIFSILENLKQRRVTVLIAMHDLNLAAERFEKVMLLNHRLIGFGNPKQIFTPEQLRLAYGHHLHLVGAGETWLALEDTCCDEGEQA